MGGVFGKCCSFRIAKESIPKKITLGQSSEGAQETRQTDISRCVLGRGNSQCKGSEMGTCVVLEE